MTGARRGSLDRRLIVWNSQVSGVVHLKLSLAPKSLPSSVSYTPHHGLTVLHSFKTDPFPFFFSSRPLHTFTNIRHE